MAIKLTYKFVADVFEREGYKLVSKEYANCDTKLLTICPKGHEWETTYHGFRMGNKRFICYGTPKYTYAEVKGLFERESDTFINFTRKQILLWHQALTTLVPL